MNTLHKIQQLILGKKFANAGSREVAKLLGMYAPYEIKTVEQALNALAAKGAVYRNKSLYSISRAKKQPRLDTAVKPYGKKTPKRSDALYRGTLKGNKRGFAFLIREDGGDDLFVPHRYLGGANHGDTVTARIIKGDEAEITTIENRGLTRLVGTFTDRGSHGTVTPADSNYYNEMRIAASKKNGAVTGDKVIADIERYKEDGTPIGAISEIILGDNPTHTEILGILRSYGFDDKFPESVLTEAFRAGGVNTEGRTDHRELKTITIDGDDSKDFDDAISLIKTAKGYTLYVHIADVAHYVPEGGALDTEALKRGTSVYFPQQVYPMLPETLSNGICSLSEGNDRLTLTVKICLDKKGKVQRSEIYESVIRSDRRMTYANVTKILDGDKNLNTEYADLNETLLNMLELKNLLEAERELRGSINFESKESKINLSGDGKVLSVERYPISVSNGIIEEFMLLANEEVAKYAAANRIPCVYRTHEEPDKEKIKSFQKLIAVYGYSIDLGNVTPKSLQKVLRKLENEEYYSVMNKILLRSMQKARYETDNKGHFGLALSNYCHFTSPIRRYPDLIVHRMLKAFIHGESVDSPKNISLCGSSAVRSSMQEVKSEQAEREADDYYKALYMSERVGKRYSARISGVTEFALFAELDNTVEGCIRIEHLPPDEYEFIPERLALKGVAHMFSVGQPIEILVASATPEDRRINFSLIDGDDAQTVEK